MSLVTPPVAKPPEPVKAAVKPAAKPVPAPAAKPAPAPAPKAPVAPVAPVAPPPPPGMPEDQLLRPMDIGALRNAIYNSSFEAIKNLEPVQNSRYRLSVENPRWVDPENYSPAQQKKAFYQGGTLARRIAADWVLTDAQTNEPVSRKSATIASVPHMNDRGFFLLNGSHWHLGAQTRLDPGIYPRRQENGEISAYVNPKGGRPHHISLDPSNGVFYFEIGSNKLPLVSVLKAMGTDPDKIKEAWGHNLVASNAEKDDPKAISKLYKKLFDNGKPVMDSEERRLVTEKLKSWSFDPYVTKQTIGKDHANYSSDSLLETTKRLLAISRKEAEPVDRDDQSFQRIMGQEHLFAERLKNSKQILNQLLWKATSKGNLDNAPGGALSQHLLETITGSGLGVNAQVTNPAEVLDAVYRVSKMGRGGISSLDSVPDSCFDEETQVYTKEGWKFWREVTERTKFACRIDGALSFFEPLRLYCSDYEGDMYGIKTLTLDHLVTPNHRIWCRKYRSTGCVAKRGMASWGFELAKDTHRKPREFMLASAPYEGRASSAYIVIPAVDKAKKKSLLVKSADWAEFVGWFAAEGSLVRKDYRVIVSQSKQANPDKVGKIAAVLTAIGKKWNYQSGHNFNFCCKSTYNWLIKHVGVGSKNKRLPAGFIDWTVEARTRLFEALVAGDGSTAENGLITFTSTSKKLRDDFLHLATSLGFATKERKDYQPKRENHNLAYYGAVLSIDKQGVTSERFYDTAYYIKPYKGKVYCAEVPGGLLLVRRGRSVGMWSGNSRDVTGTQFGFIDPAVTPESGKIGVDLRFGSGTARSKDGRIYSKFHDAAGNPQWLSARDVRDKVIGAWEHRNSTEPFVEAMKNGSFSLQPKSAVELWTHPTEHSFSPVANLIPFKSSSPQHRTAMGARMMTQALPLIGGESPLVQTGHPDGGSFEQHYGKHFGAIRAEKDGKIMAVTPDAIKVKYEDGTTNEITLRNHEMYDHAPGRKTHFTQQAMLQPGEYFSKNQLLAKSNYTDNKGHVALGKNARVAWLPARMGGAFEDAFAVSQSYADSMKSDHMAVHGVDEAGAQFGKNKFRALYANKYAPELLKDLDDDGVIKPGTTVKPGQPLVLAFRKVDAPRTTLVRSLKPIHQDISEVWDHDYPGKVVDVIKTKGGYKVSVKSEVPMQLGDKIAGRHGNKGIVTIIPDHEMPIGEDGKPFDILASPYTLSSRKNTSQIAEVVLGKIAEKRGEGYAVPDFQMDDLMKFVEDEAKKYGVKSDATESITDPKTGAKIHGVLTGKQYFMKLHHVVESKIKQRDTGGYDAFDTPAKGGSTGAKRMSLADTFALVAHGANAFLSGSQNVRGQRNENFWEATMSGFTPPMPGESVQYQRFINGLKSTGVHPYAENGKIRLKALTDDHIQHLAGDRELLNPKGLDWSRDGDPHPGGLFDKKIFGEGYNLWGKIKLHEKMPNPAFEDPVRYTLGLTEKQMRKVIAGQAGFADNKFVDPKEDEPKPENFKTGTTALYDQLKNIDLDKEIADAHGIIGGTKKTKRDAAIRRLKYLQGAKDQGVHPSQWMIENVPVLPPRFRPVSKLQGSNTELVSDPNYLYQDLFHANHNLKSLHSRLEDLSEEKLALYDSLKAVTGLGDPINPKTQQKNVKGMMRLLLAESPKWSIPQHKLLSSPVDLVGRSTIAPDASLDMDEIGIPEDMAFKTYSRFLIKNLVQGGVSPVEADRMVENKSPEARTALLKEMEKRPISYHRAPVLHQFGHIGAWPKLIKGDVIKMSPFVYKGMGADNDGDTVNIHVPVYDKEIDDITDKMMPSKNLLSVKDFAPHYKPEREFHVGLWQATEPGDKETNPSRKRTFQDMAALKAAFAKGEVTVRDHVTVLKH